MKKRYGIGNGIVRALAALTLMTSFTLIGCVDVKPDTSPIDERPEADRDDDTPNTSDTTGLVRALHVSRIAPPLRLTFDEGEPMVESIRFGGITDDTAMLTGTHAFDVLRVDNGDQMASSDELALQEGASWSFFVWGDLESMRASLIENAQGRGYRVINAVPGNVDINVDLRQGGSSSGTQNEVANGQASVVVQTTDETQASGAQLAIDQDGDGSTDVSFSLPAAGSDGRVTDLYVVGASDQSGGTVTLLACSDGSLIEVPADGPLPDARIRALHLSPNAPNVDIFVNGGAAITDLAFRNASPYASLPPSLYDIDVAPAGAGIDSAVLSADRLELLSAQSYTAVAFGSLPNIRALALVDDYSPVTAGKVRVRAAHTADGVGQVDILAVGDDDQTFVIYDDVDFAAVADYIEIDSAAIKLGLDLDDDGQPELTFDVPALPVGTVATIFAVLDAQGAPFLLAATEDATVAINAIVEPPPPPVIEIANVRVVHLSPDAPAVAVNANGARLIETLEFFNATDFLEVEAGTYDLDVALAASPDAALLSLVDTTLAPNTFTTAVAVGRAAELSVIAFAEDRSAPAAGNIRVRAIHAAVGVGNVDIYAVTPQGNVRLYDNVPFGTAGDALEVPAGQYNIGLDLNEDTHPDLHFQLPALDAGAIANLYAVTDAHGNASLAIQQ